LKVVPFDRLDMVSY